MADDKLYTSLSANKITANLTDHFQRTNRQLTMTSAHVVETSVTNSSFQNYPHPDDHTEYELSDILHVQLF